MAKEFAILISFFLSLPGTHPTEWPDSRRAPNDSTPTSSQTRNLQCVAPAGLGQRGLSGLISALVNPTNRTLRKLGASRKDETI